MRRGAAHSGGDDMVGPAFDARRGRALPGPMAFGVSRQSRLRVADVLDHLLLGAANGAVSPGACCRSLDFDGHFTSGRPKRPAPWRSCASARRRGSARRSGRLPAAAGRFDGGPPNHEALLARADKRGEARAAVVSSVVSAPRRTAGDADHRPVRGRRFDAAGGGTKPVEQRHGGRAVLAQPPTSQRSRRLHRHRGDAAGVQVEHGASAGGRPILAIAAKTLVLPSARRRARLIAPGGRRRPVQNQPRHRVASNK